MSAAKNTFQVGIVTILIVVTFFATLLWISQRVSGDVEPITIRFRSSPDMPTIVKGSDVLVGGQKVGKVRSAALTAATITDPVSGRPVERFFVMVTADVLSNVRSQLRADCKVVAEGPPLGGDAIVKLALGDSPESLPPDTVIEGSEPAGFAAILSSLQDEFNGENPASLLGRIKSQLDPDETMSLMGKLLASLNDVNAITATLNKQFTTEDKATLLAKIQEIADNINAATSALRGEFNQEKPEVLLGKLHLAMDAVNDGLTSLTRILKTNEPAINKTFVHVESAAGNIATQLDPAVADSLMSNFRQAGQKLSLTLADIQTVTGTTREIVVLNQQNINRMLMNFKEASDHVKTGMKYVLRHPWRLMNAPPASEVRQQAIFDAARSFAEAATRIDDAAAQLRALSELHNGAIPSDSPDLARLEEDLKQTQEKYQRAEMEFWRQLGGS